MTTDHKDLPPLPSNVSHVMRRIRACESEVPAQLVLEHALHAYAREALAAQRVLAEGAVPVDKASQLCDMGVHPVAMVEEELEDNCARVRWIYNPVPVGQELRWDHGTPSPVAPPAPPQAAPTSSQAVPEGWTDAYASFQAAFDTPVARRKHDDEYAEDARRRMRELNERFVPATPSQPVEQVPSDADYAFDDLNLRLIEVTEERDHLRAALAASRTAEQRPSREVVHSAEEILRVFKTAEFAREDMPLGHVKRVAEAIVSLPTPPALPVNERIAQALQNMLAAHPNANDGQVGHETHVTQGQVTACREARAALAAQPRSTEPQEDAEQAADAARWISVDDRLPEVVNLLDGSVNSVLVLFTERRAPECGSRWQVANTVWAQKAKLHGVTHWMPLPAPPAAIREAMPAPAASGGGEAR